MASAIAAACPELILPDGEPAMALAWAIWICADETVDIPAASLVSSPFLIGRRPPYVGGPRSTKTIPPSVMLPRFVSYCTNRASANATRRSNDVLKTLSALPGLGLRDSQNFSTNSARSAPADSDAQAFFSPPVMIQRTGPS